MSANESKTATNSDWTYRWSLDGEWKGQTGKVGVEMALKSEYAYDGGKETADRLRTSMRLVHNGYGKDAGDWRPVLLMQTEGDHSAEKLFTLLAVGYRLQFKSGYLEVTTGASKDVRTANKWVGDTGIGFSFERQINKKLKFRTGPRAEVATLGDVRLRDNRVRYTWDASLDYQLTNTVGIGYRIWEGNTNSTQRTQMLGLTFKFK